MPSTMSTSTSQKTLSRIAANRLQKELAEWQLNPPVGFKHRVTDNLQRWIIEVTGAPGTLYTNEQYQLQVDFPEHYPMEAPQNCEGGDQNYGPGHKACLFLLFGHLHTVSSITPSHIQQRSHLPRYSVRLVVTSYDSELHLYQHSIHVIKLYSEDLAHFGRTKWVPAKARPPDNDRYVKNCRNGRSPKETRWWFHDDTV